MKRRVEVVLCASVLAVLTACGKTPSDFVQVNDILEKQNYMEVSFGDAYHQEKVQFNLNAGRAVIPFDAEWGKPGFREKETAGIYYGTEEGGEIYDAEWKTMPEFYVNSYMDSLRNLNLTVSEVKKEDYVIKVTDSSELEWFEEELRKLSTLVLKDTYELTSVEIEFDKQCRPTKKVFQLQKLDIMGMKRGKIVSKKCTQEFSYKLGKIKFGYAFRKVKKEIIKQ